MAGGFWKGLLHGVVIGAAGLIGLSLMTPLPETPVTALPAGVGGETPVSVQAVPAPVQSAPKAESPPETPAPASAAGAVVVIRPDPPAEKKPLAEMVDLPPGSEFGRGGDKQLQRPAPFTADTGRAGISEPPSISAPSADSALIPTAATNQRPATGLHGYDISPPTNLAVGETPEFTRPAGQSAPAEAVRPGMAGNSGGHDRIPVSVPVYVVDTGAEPVQPDTPGATIPSEPQKVSQDAAPALQTPAFDLSMPPDLSNLRALQRN